MIYVFFHVVRNVYAILFHIALPA